MVRYVVALLSVVGSLTVIHALEVAHLQPGHVSLFLCGVMFSAWFGGVWPGLFATGAALLAFDYFYLSPTYSLALKADQLPRLVLFTVCALFVIALTGAQRAAAASLLRTHEALQRRSRELEETNRSLEADHAERTRAEYLTGRILETLTGNVAIIGRDYRFLLVNQDYEEMLEMPASQIVGSDYASVMGEEIFALAKPLIDRCFGGEIVHFAGWFPLRYGNRYVVGTCTPYRPNSDEVEATLVIGRDFTESAQAADALRETQAKLEHAARIATLGEVTASLAHELNPPLTAIMNNANACLGLLPSDSPEPDDLHGALTDIVDDATRASAIIGRVRALAKRSVPERIPLRLRDVVDDVLTLVAADSRSRRVTIHSDVPADLPAVVGDRVQLQQVLLNLVANGMDAVHTRKPQERTIEIRGQQEIEDADHGVKISVQDNGVGLHPEQAERLFEAFYTTKPNGMGLGLLISRSIIETHGGRLWAEPNHGPGVTFSFRLPASAT
jgi:C4-dicarboxylate-specific signal transduction histidine kinase